ncbi:MAG: hypothetical protein A2W05_08460 [Candidatus Schekmanbacteria bacterium RBG_16_38_10]|uniref:site-specific DNA-methyltransferase (adenine-specific) n=1 Tax=Candidatus Schekmanbacteria bacterium RBG_16_38_10 TaxID=1817879 RepID=A0A1F7RXP3_9BACT|nr:MAG: hypothetical protein A2W05_08460 [Candidatus Schekmanbacteria bacterium RBG_16_38_10]
MPKRSEDSYIVHDIIPLLSKLGYPGTGDHERVKIKEVPIYRPSGGIAGKMDIVYYQDGEPVLLVEAKRAGRSIKQAQEEAENYLRNFPIKNKKYAPKEQRPCYFAITVGREIQFYRHRFDVSNGLLEQISESISILTFDELLDKYGLTPGYRPKKLDTESFGKEFWPDLVSFYKTSEDSKITQEVIKRVSKHILNYLENKHTYDTHSPFVEHISTLSNQEHIKDLHRRFDLAGSLNTEIAEEFRNFILRSFQGNEFNQYLTEKCIILFMLNLIGEIKSHWKVLDFECGSGGFISAAAKKGVPIENMLGIDIDELPFIIAKTYLALYFRKTGKEIAQIPIRNDNGLLYLRNEWDLVIGNPAGSGDYKKDDIENVLKNLERDLDQNGKDDKFSEYNFSIQQAVRSCKVGGKICLILPDPFFSGSRNKFLRKYIAKHCKVLAIVSLPSGVFKKGTSTKSMGSGSQKGTQKMSILYAEKTSPVIDGEGIEVDDAVLSYPVFLANISPPESTTGNICEWLEPRLNMVLEEWRKWQAEKHLSALDETLLKDAYESQKNTQGRRKSSKKDDKQMRLLSEEPSPVKRPKKVKSKVIISKALGGLFKENKKK